MHEETFDLLRNAIYHLGNAVKAAPKSSNLRDDLTAALETLEEIQDASAEYNDVGMAV